MMIIFERAREAGGGDVAEPFADLLACESVVAEEAAGDAHAFIRCERPRRDPGLRMEDPCQMFPGDMQLFRDCRDIQLPFQIGRDELSARNCL